MVPRCELRGAEIIVDGHATKLVLKLEHGHELKAVIDVYSRATRERSTGWRYMTADRAFEGHEVAELMIADLRAEVPVDVRWARSGNNLVWTRTENAR